MTPSQVGCAVDYEDYKQYDAVGLAELVARGDASPAELLEAALARAEAVNGKINAIVRPMPGVARERAADELTGPFAGVPFLIKDLMQDYEGRPTGRGSRAAQGLVAARHSEAVRRWLDAGLVVFGQTNTPEFGIKSVTEPEANGATRNPWDLGRTPGGSSGGSAAAVAAGIVPAAGANDGGGSIRIPAACCGLFGLKPGRGLVPAGPAYGELLAGAATDGVVSRTVRDSAALLDVLTAHPDPGGPYLAARPEEPYAELARRTPRRLRVGVSTRSPIGTPVAREAVEAVDAAVKLLTGLGHEVEEAEPAVDGLRMADDFMTMYAVENAAALAELKHRTGAGDDQFELDTHLIAAAGRAVGAVEHSVRHARWNTYARQLAAFHQTYDVLLTPTLARPPVRIGELDTPWLTRQVGKALLKAGVAGRFSRTGLWKRSVVQNLAPNPFTQLANITGRPAMSVPLYRTPDGLPLGVQFGGPLGSEGLLLALAGQLESAAPWAQERPTL
ncbi:amidase [Streptomyces spectabilis]|uniref:Amidase n=1 Tax=Streptomyces spectabilis TaxID=68270 RepID=A0A7W8AMS3_STRST|nr:amidase family protein [Streptomyces spectabilis]MBB5101310.1 amidase [Streptomyces spectabilis]MCI3900509.1 amidase family protein [Streptomyces spectabilis]GGV10582.1 putative amidase [Streptomyces spectabilis]